MDLTSISFSGSFFDSLCFKIFLSTWFFRPLVQISIETILFFSSSLDFFFILFWKLCFQFQEKCCYAALKSQFKMSLSPAATLYQWHVCSDDCFSLSYCLGYFPMSAHWHSDAKWQESRRPWNMKLSLLTVACNIKQSLPDRVAALRSPGTSIAQGTGRSVFLRSSFLELWGQEDLSQHCLLSGDSQISDLPALPKSTAFSPH